MCSLVICVFSLLRCPSMSLSYFLVSVFVLLLLGFKSPLYIMHDIRLLDVSLANIFLQSMACLFIWTVSFREHEFLIVTKSS